MRIIISTEVTDAHSAAVQMALTRKGHDVVKVLATNYPTKQAVDLSVSNHRPASWRISDQDIGTLTMPIDVVWSRRPQQPKLPADTLHPADEIVAERENREFYKSLWRVISQNAFWINPIESYDRSNCKITQLCMAKDVGLKIPATLMTNDPISIRNFIRACSDRGAIYKAFMPENWLNEDSYLVAQTNSVTIENLPNEALLRLAAGIFQERIDKAYEIRATFFGDYPISVKIMSQSHPAGALDWRAIPPQEIRIERCELPTYISDCCKKLMRRLGIVFGCFDFIVTQDDDFIFLEINPMGQFLWIEWLDNSIKMLDTFCSFVTSRSRSFQPSGSPQDKNSLSLPDIMHTNEYIKFSKPVSCINQPS